MRSHRHHRVAHILDLLLVSLLISLTFAAYKRLDGQLDQFAQTWFGRTDRRFASILNLVRNR